MPRRQLLDLAMTWGLDWDLFWRLTPWSVALIILARRRAWMRDRMIDAVGRGRVAASMAGGSPMEIALEIFPDGDELLK